MMGRSFDAGGTLATTGDAAGKSRGDAGQQKGDANLAKSGAKICAMLRAQLGEEVYSSWFNSLEFDRFDGHTLYVSVAVKFLRNWIQSHYLDTLLASAKKEFKTIENVDISVRQPGKVQAARAQAGNEAVQGQTAESASRMNSGMTPTPIGQVISPMPRPTTTMAAGFEGSPIDPRYTFDSFIVGAANRIAHAGASQVAETIFSGSSGFNPLYIHSAVGLGKTHLLQAVAWEVRRRVPQAQILYLTAEQFRYRFVEALQAKDALAFKDRFNSIDMLLIDDLEFMYGQHTEQEFEHIINSLLDGGKQVVVASARAPNSVERLSDRMRTRLQRGLVTEISSPDYELRRKIIERRVQEKQQIDASFEVPLDVMDLMAHKLTENGRELEGAIIRLHAHWQYMHTPISVEVAETVIRDLVQGAEPHRVRIEDIIKLVSRHYGISKPDILSQRRHRSVVWPRQIGMYLSKQLTARSLPEIGRRFGDRDHTTVLHAIRKIDKVISENPRVHDEIEELKKLLRP